MEHQYPVAITGDENMLAELMLPDQAHARNQDWTIFFLHKDMSDEEEDEERNRKERRRRRRHKRRALAAGVVPSDQDEDDDAEETDDDYDDDYDDDTDTEPEGGEGPPLIYVLNLVNTKHDKTVKRGAVVKAMAICTRHPFLHIYKVRPPSPTPFMSFALANFNSRCFFWPLKNTSSLLCLKHCLCFIMQSMPWTCL